MDKQLRFDYYYGIEAEQFSFYRVPRMLIKDERFKGLSSDAKLLYGLMLDRLSLSMVLKIWCGNWCRLITALVPIRSLCLE